MTFEARGLYASSSKEPRSKSFRSLILLGGLVALVALVWVVGMVAALATESEQDKTSEHSGAAVVQIANQGSGDVRVSAAGEGEDVTLTRTLHDNMFTTASDEVSESGEVLSVESQCTNSLFGRCSVDYEVRVPPGTDVQITGSSGDVEVEEVRGDLEVQLASGDIEVSSVEGNVSAFANSGDIEVGEISGSVDLEAQSGDLSAEGSGEELRAVTASGDIEVDGFTDAETVTAESSSGDVDLSGLAARSIQAEASSGTITVEAVEEFEDLSADSSSGDVEVIVPDGAGPFQVTGDTNSGERDIQVETSDTASARIEATTSSGDVRVE